MFDAVEERLGHLDVVVHTAGINHPAALADLDLDDFDEVGPARRWVKGQVVYANGGLA